MLSNFIYNYVVEDCYMYYVYILKSLSGKIYFGFTGDLKRRLAEHNRKICKTTSHESEWRIVWYCAFHEKTKALSFEKYLKHGSGHAFMKKRFL